MEERSITITLNKAREWFKNRDAALKEIALQAFSEDELTDSFKKITTFKKACKTLDLDYEVESAIIEDIEVISKASAAMFQLNIIKKAINLGYDLHLTKDPEKSQIYYPLNPIITEDSTYYENELNHGYMEIIGKIKSEETLYSVLAGYVDNYECGVGLSYFDKPTGVGYTDASIGFLGCATEEIAKHFGKYFGMLITEAKYGDLVDFEITRTKY